MPESIYETIFYTRASKDDPDSETIENQISYIKSYIAGKSDLRVKKIYSDNGHSGADFNRPGFLRMMEDIARGEVECIIVKDLSRLSRNYIDALGFIRRTLPDSNVRFISINDNYDSLYPQRLMDNLILPFQTLLNEHTLADTSKKIRSSLSSLRDNGDFVSAFAPYGYKRDQHNKHRLVPDEHAAAVVRLIYKEKMTGASNQQISDKLNESGEPSPLEYKLQNGVAISSKLKTNVKALWSPVAVKRILENPVYIGTLQQGKQTTPNFKVKTRIDVPRAEWAITANAHTAIIEKVDYEIVQNILSRDLRRAPEGESVYPFAGIIRCASCGGSMVRKKVGKYTYYVCSTHKANKHECSSHSTSVKELDEAVRAAINLQLKFLRSIEENLEKTWMHPIRKQRAVHIQNSITQRIDKIAANERYRLGLHGDLTDGLISREEFMEFNEQYSSEIAHLKASVCALEKEKAMLQEKDDEFIRLVERFRDCQDVTELSRGLVVSIVKQIIVGENKKIEVNMRFNDYIRYGLSVIEGSGPRLKTKEGGDSLYGPEEQETAVS